MRCKYCGVEVTNYPDNGICVCCGGKLPARPVGIRCPGCGTYSSGNFCSVCGRNINPSAPAQPVQPVVQQVYIPVQQPLYRYDVSCPKCRSMQISTGKRGFRWGLGILGFFVIPVIGLTWGFHGSRKLYHTCNTCGHKWKAN